MAKSQTTQNNTLDPIFGPKDKFSLLLKGIISKGNPIKKFSLQWKTKLVQNLLIFCYSHLDHKQ